MTDPREVTTIYERTAIEDQLERDATTQRLCETTEHIDFFWKGPEVGARFAKISTGLARPQDIVHEW